MLGTIEAVEEDLMRDGLLLRYRTESGVDGLAGDEHPFLACSFWLVAAYARAGRLDDAHALMERLLGLRQRRRPARPRSTTPARGRFVGNFPQAFSHLALVGAAPTSSPGPPRHGSARGRGPDLRRSVAAAARDGPPAP